MAKKPASKQPIPVKKPAAKKTRETATTSAKGPAKVPAKKAAAPAASAAGGVKEIRIPEGKMPVLHIGCGPYSPHKLPEIFRDGKWHEVRLDIDPSVNPDIVASMTDMSMVPTGSMGAIFSSHNIEHLYPHQVPIAFKEFLRVLRPGGMFLVTLPDIQAVAAYVAEGLLEDTLYESPAGPISPVDIMYGFRKSMAQGNLFMAHKMGFSARSLASHLLSAGFCNVNVRRDWVDLWARAYKLPEGDERRHMRATIVNGSLEAKGKARPLPEWYKRRLQMEENPEVKTDDLETPPVYWQAPNLKK